MKKTAQLDANKYTLIALRKLWKIPTEKTSSQDDQKYARSFTPILKQTHEKIIFTT